MSHGRYSRTCCRALEQAFNIYRRQQGPISERTRSRVRPRNSSNSDRNVTSLLTTPSAGQFSQTQRVTRITQARAEHSLRRSRVKLRAYLKSELWRRDIDPEDQDRYEPTREQIEQLGTLDAVGNIESIPRARPGEWSSDLRMISKRARRRARPSKLSEVDYSYTEQELDELFGLLPCEEQGVEDLDAEMDVTEQLTEESKVEEALWDGEKTEGVWSHVSGSLKGESVASVAQWAFARGRAWEQRVMDPRCIEVVKKVLNVEQ